MFIELETKYYTVQRPATAIDNGRCHCIQYKKDYYFSTNYT